MTAPACKSSMTDMFDRPTSGRRVVFHRDGTGRDGTGRDGSGRDGTGRDGTKRDGTRRDAAELW